eukprot:764705-Hanusia_phi.AAC.2
MSPGRGGCVHQIRLWLKGRTELLEQHAMMSGSRSGSLSPPDRTAVRASHPCPPPESDDSSH